MKTYCDLCFINGKNPPFAINVRIINVSSHEILPNKLVNLCGQHTELVNNTQIVYVKEK